MADMLRIFKSLSDPTRLRIIRLLLDRDLCVCEITYILEMAQSRVSHQLRILRDAGLVEDIRDGQWIIYRLPDRGRSTIGPLLALFPETAGKNGAAEADRRRLALCLSREIRKTRCPVPSSSARRAEKAKRKSSGKPAGKMPRLHGGDDGH